MNKHSVAAGTARGVAARHLRSDLDLTPDEAWRLIDLALDVKARPAHYAEALRGSYISLLFEKPSLRTRFTFELAIQQLGGGSAASIGPIGEREPTRDMARNLDRWTQAIVARTFTQETVDELARYSRVPVINALSNRYHPCQAMADFQTVRERFGAFHGTRLAFVGDGFNVAHSLMLTGAQLGAGVVVATPKGYEPRPEIVAAAQDIARRQGGEIQVTNNPEEAVRGAHAVYTDVWFSMGEDCDVPKRLEDFGPFQVNEALMAKAHSDAIFLHCLPAKRGEETTDTVMESTQSAIYDQAENRLHAQKALLLMLLG
ncbi:MAG: ornithine carbamoyltransferase [Acidobacteria bacterium]|nr:ornithine carbamoyltransferase [Acidobacteriota bacterium]